MFDRIIIQTSIISLLLPFAAKNHVYIFYHQDSPIFTTSDRTINKKVNSKCKTLSYILHLLKK